MDLFYFLPLELVDMIMKELHYIYTRDLLKEFKTKLVMNSLLPVKLERQGYWLYEYERGYLKNNNDKYTCPIKHRKNLNKILLDNHRYMIGLRARRRLCHTFNNFEGPVKFNTI